MQNQKTYDEFLEAKKVRAIESGFDIDESELNPMLFDFQKYCVRRMLKQGRGALFANTGLGKTPMQLEWAQKVYERTGKPVVILAPLSVSRQTIREGAKFGYTVNLFRDKNEGLVITNYEQVEKLNPADYSGVVLDESSILKNFTGHYKNLLIQLFKETPYKLCCTATPSPNDLNELGNHSEFLNILDSQDMRSKWFVRDEGMNNYRLKSHAKADFYGWVSSWAINFKNPDDLGFIESGKKFNLPDLNIIEHRIETEAQEGYLFSYGIVNATNFNSALKETEIERLALAAKLAKESDGQVIIWIKQNREGEALRKLLPEAVEVKGSDSDSFKEQALSDFADGAFSILITKAKIAGYGMNFQNCGTQIFASPDFSFENFYQQVRRSYRFGRTEAVTIHLIVTDNMENVKAVIDQKQRVFDEMQEQMNANMNNKSYGLLDDYEYREYRDDNVFLMKGDTCREIKRIDDNSVDFTIYSPPFSSLFTYSNYIHDMGNNDSHDDFFKQYAFLLKDLYRILKPGRLMVCHTKDLGVYKNSSGYTGQYDFTRFHTQAVEDAGFKLHSKITIWTDPVLEMQRTKTQRLLYKQVTSDSTKSGVGMAEYLTIFKKWDGNEEDYTPVTSLSKDIFDLDKWQNWASPVFEQDLSKYDKKELIETIRFLKSEIFRIQNQCNPGLPEGWYSDVWFDIKRTDVLNGKEGTAMGDEKHIAPLQLEVIHRAVMMWTNPGETVFTPFLGIGSEAYQSILDGRKAIGCELKDSYFDVAVRNCKKAAGWKSQIEIPFFQ